MCLCFFVPLFSLVGTCCEFWKQSLCSSGWWLLRHGFNSKTVTPLKNKCVYNDAASHLTNRGHLSSVNTKGHLFWVKKLSFFKQVYEVKHRNCCIPLDQWCPGHSWDTPNSWAGLYSPLLHTEPARADEHKWRENKWLNVSRLYLDLQSWEKNIFFILGF